MPGFKRNASWGGLMKTHEDQMTELGLMLTTGKDANDPKVVIDNIDAELALHLRSKRGRRERRTDEQLWLKRLDVWLDVRAEVMRSMGVEFPEPDWEALGVAARPLTPELEALARAAKEVESPHDS